MMKSKVVVITGARTGIGREAAIQFAKAGHTVVMGCRNLEKSRQVQDEVIRLSENEQVFLLPLDCSDMASLSRFSDALHEQFQAVDVLIHNAAYVEHGAPHKLGDCHVELTFFTNVVAPFVLTLACRDLLQKSDDPRVLHAGSNIIKHYFDPQKHIDLERLKGPWQGDDFSVYAMYQQSKIALVMLNFKMADRLKEDGIAVNALQINGAKLSRDTLAKMSLKWRVTGRLQSLFLKHPSYMAERYVRLTTDEAFKGMTGLLFNDELAVMKPAPSRDLTFLDNIRLVSGKSHYPFYAQDQQDTERVWAFCEQIVGKKALS